MTSTPPGKHSALWAVRKSKKKLVKNCRENVPGASFCRPFFFGFFSQCGGVGLQLWFVRALLSFSTQKRNENHRWLNSEMWRTDSSRDAKVGQWSNPLFLFKVKFTRHVNNRPGSIAYGSRDKSFWTFKLIIVGVSWKNVLWESHMWWSHEEKSPRNNF